MIGQELETRAGLYGLLRSLYTYPLTEPLLSQLFAVERDLHTVAGARLAALQDTQANRPLSTARVAQLNVEMTRLLEGPGLTPAPPYASFYLHDGRLMGPMAVDARMSYLAWEIIPDTLGGIPDDHIALELGFLAHLADVAATSDDGGRVAAALRDSQRFVDEQLNTWLGRFCSDLAHAARDPFFRELARFTQEAVAADRRQLSDLLGPLEPVASATPSPHRGREG